MGWLLGNRGQRPNFDEKWAAKGGGGLLMGNRLALLIQVGQAVKQAGEGQLGQGELERMQEKGAKGRVVEIDGTSFKCLCQCFTIGKNSVKAFDSKVPQRTGRTGH